MTPKEQKELADRLRAAEEAGTKLNFLSNAIAVVSKGTIVRIMYNRSPTDPAVSDKIYPLYELEGSKDLLAEVNQFLLLHLNARKDAVQKEYDEV